MEIFKKNEKGWCTRRLSSDSNSNVRIFLPVLLEQPVMGITFPEEHLIVDKIFLLKKELPFSCLNIHFRKIILTFS